ncbi:MAG: hypothetical protein IKR83_01155 [Bacteroidales bacterium]|nr:hypothetical protein [Bacteroidales bacterium]
MRRRAIIFCLLAMLCIGGAAAWKYRARWFHTDRVSPLYELYQGSDGIEADFVGGMRVSDSLRIDVTRLHATDSVAWQRLTKDFAVPPATESEERMLARGRDFARLVHYPASLPADSTLPPPVTAVSPLRHTITVFHVKNEGEKHAIVYYNFDSGNKEK